MTPICILDARFLIGIITHTRKKVNIILPPKYFLPFLLRIDDLYVDICTSIMQIGVIYDLYYLQS